MILKRSILTIILYFFVLTFLHSQNKTKLPGEFKPEWEIGAGFGINLSSVDFASTIGSYGVKTSNKQGHMGGIAVRYISEKNLGLIAELNYTQVGWMENYAKDAEAKPIFGTFAHSHSIDYIEIPILTHIYFGNKVRFFINLGPKIGMLLQEKEFMNQALADYLASGDADQLQVTDQYYHKVEKKFDYGLMGAFGMEFRSKFGMLDLEARYYYGLSDIYNSSKSDYFAKSANRNIGIKLTYYIKIH